MILECSETFLDRYRMDNLKIAAQLSCTAERSTSPL